MKDWADSIFQIEANLKYIIDNREINEMVGYFLKSYYGTYLDNFYKVRDYGVRYFNFYFVDSNERTNFMYSKFYEDVESIFVYHFGKNYEVWLAENFDNAKIARINEEETRIIEESYQYIKACADIIRKNIEFTNEYKISNKNRKDNIVTVQVSMDLNKFDKYEYINSNLIIDILQPIKALNIIE